MYAIIRTGGKQYKVAKGDVVDVERLTGPAEAEVVFDQVLAVAKDDGELRIGDPLVKGAAARGRILGEAKGEKVIVFKYKNKVNYRRKKGHRQVRTRVRIEEIDPGR